jgi:hypothetical protein
MLAVTDLESKRVGLYHIPTRTHAARLVETLEPPSGTARALSVRLTVGAHPQAFVLWKDSAGTVLLRYTDDSPDGDRIALGVAPTSVAISADGRKIAWLAGKPPGYEPNPDVFVADLSGNGVRAVTQLRADANSARGGGDTQYAPSVGEMTWAGDTSLLLGLEYESGEGDKLVRVDVDQAKGAGWGERTGFMGPTHAEVTKGFELFDVTCPSEGGRALAVEGPRLHVDGPTRAVWLDVATGEVLGVVATPASGRSVVSVSGGSRGALYETSGPQGDRTYWRTGGEARGQLLVGLPPGPLEAVAQP